MSNHNFKLLIIEDETILAEYIAAIFYEINRRVDITYAKSRDEAFGILENHNCFFDFITLDLSIPAINDSFEKTPINGLAVLGRCQQYSQGTPLLIFTGTSTVEMMANFLRNSHNVDVWAEGVARPTIDHLTKTEMVAFRAKVTEIVTAVLSLSDIELNCNFQNLPIEHDRLIRVFTKKQGGFNTQVTQIGGGLSDAKVYGLHVMDERGSTLHRAIAKCGPKKDIDKDAANYDSKINRLRPEVTPRKLQHIKFSAKSTSGVFYSLAADYNYSFFKAIENGLMSREIRDFVSTMMDSWHNSSSQKRVKIKTIRQKLVNDETYTYLIEKYELNWANEFEEHDIQANISCLHGDLHGENILIDVVSNRATLIDYGDVSEGSLAIDPITLECSFLFHPAAPKHDWPSHNNIENWENLELYLEGCPIAEDIRFCRAWGQRVQAGKRELAACLYSYSLRQLKYEKTNKEIALKLLEAALRVYNNS